jgi:hypothetical protein
MRTRDSVFSLSYLVRGCSTVSTNAKQFRQQLDNGGA